MNKKYFTIFACMMILLVGCTHEKSPAQESIERAREAYSKGFYIEAEKEYELYLQISSQGEFRREAWDRLCDIALSVKGDFDRCIVLLEAMYLELGPDPKEAWRIMFQLGEVYVQLNNQSHAIECFEKSLTHATHYPEKKFETQIRLAKLYRAMGNHEMVVDTLKQCVDSAKDEKSKGICLYELAQSYSFISNWNQSKRALQELLTLNDVSKETRVLAQFLLADIYENEREYEKAQELLTSLIETYPNPIVIEKRLANLPYIPPSQDAPPPKK